MSRAISAGIRGDLMPFRYQRPLYSELAEVAKIAMESEVAEKVTEAIYDNAKSIAQQEGETQFAENLKIEAGERPKGRPFRRVIADDSEGERKEFGDTNQARLRILGRAAGVIIFPDTK